MRGTLRRAAALLALVGTASCMDATDVTVLEVDATGVVFGIAFLDANGNDALDAGDEALPGVRVTLTGGRGTRVDEAVTDTAGLYTLRNIPVGSYVLEVDPASLGDSLQVAEGFDATVDVTLGDTIQVNLPLGFPFLTLEEVRALPAGRKVVTSGIALNARLPFGDGRVHIQGDSAYLRALNVERAALSVGDSVRLLGRTARDAGQPVLVDVTPVVLVGQAAIPVPEDLTTGGAASAGDAGGLDAALVRISDAEILDTATVDGDFRFTVDDGTGPLVAVIQSFLQVNTAPIQPDTIVRIASMTGLLVPEDSGAGPVWRLYPRAATDVQIEVKQVDLALTMSADLAVATRNDTVTFTVVATNAGGLPATGVEVVDSLPLGLALLSAEPTRGTFKASTGVWTLGDMAESASDTLRLRTRVTTNLIGNLQNRARFLPLTSETDINPVNDAAAFTVQVVSQKEADVGVSADADRTEVLRGDTVELTVLAFNNGPLKATAVRIADTLPDGLALLETTASAGTYTAATGVWALDSIVAGGTETLILAAEVTTDSAAVLTNRVRSLGLQREADLNPANDTASVAVTVVTLRASDIAVTAFVDQADVVRGDTVDVRIVARNNGPFNAPRVQVSDTLPVGLALVSATATSGFYDVTTALWTLDSLRALSEDTLTLRAEVTANPPDTLVNRAHSLGPDRPNIDTVTANDTASVAVAVVDETRADLALTLSAPLSQTVPGDTFEVMVVLANNGPLRGTGIAAAVDVPPPFTLLAASAADGTFDVPTGVWTVDALNAGAADTLRVSVRADSLGTGSLSAAVTGLTEVDPDPANDSAAATVSVVEPKPTDLRLTMFANRTPVRQGDTLVFTVIVSNAGPFNAQGVSVADTLGAGLTLVSAGASRGSWDADSGLWTVGDLNALRADTLTLTTTVTTGPPGPVANVAVVGNPALPVVDSDASNDRAEVSIAVVAPAQVGDAGGAARAAPRSGAALPPDGTEGATLSGRTGRRPTGR